MSSGNEKIEKFLNEELDSEAADYMRELVTAGRARWVWDAEYPSVAGLMIVENEKIIAVLFLDQHDHEVSAEFDAMFEARAREIWKGE